MMPPNTANDCLIDIWQSYVYVGSVVRSSVAIRSSIFVAAFMLVCFDNARNNVSGVGCNLTTGFSKAFRKRSISNLSYLIALFSITAMLSESNRGSLRTGDNNHALELFFSEEEAGPLFMCVALTDAPLFSLPPGFTS